MSFNMSTLTFSCLYVSILYLIFGYPTIILSCESLPSIPSERCDLPEKPDSTVTLNCTFSMSGETEPLMEYVIAWKYSHALSKRDHTDLTYGAQILQLGRNLEVETRYKSNGKVFKVESNLTISGLQRNQHEGLYWCQLIDDRYCNMTELPNAESGTLKLVVEDPDPVTTLPPPQLTPATPTEAIPSSDSQVLVPIVGHIPLTLETIKLTVNGDYLHDVKREGEDFITMLCFGKTPNKGAVGSCELDGLRDDKAKLGNKVVIDETSKHTETLECSVDVSVNIADTDYTLVGNADLTESEKNLVYQKLEDLKDKLVPSLSSAICRPIIHKDNYTDTSCTGCYVALAIFIAISIVLSVVLVVQKWGYLHRFLNR